MRYGELDGEFDDIFGVFCFSKIEQMITVKMIARM